MVPKLVGGGALPEGVLYLDVTETGCCILLLLSDLDTLADGGCLLRERLVVRASREPLLPAVRYPT